MKTVKAEKPTRTRRATRLQTSRRPRKSAHLQTSRRPRKSTRLQTSRRSRKSTHLQKLGRSRKSTHLQKLGRSRKPTLLKETVSIRRATLFEKTISIGTFANTEKITNTGRATLFEKTTSIGTFVSAEKITLLKETTVASVGRTERNVMDVHNIAVIILIITLTLLSGFCDAQGFLHAAKIWEGKQFILLEGIKSAIGFGLGIGIYWICIRFLKEFKIVSPEIQTVGWFATTMIGVAIFSGSFFQWQRFDQVVGIFILLGIVWLFVRAAT